MTSSTTRAFMAKKPFATASAFMAKTNQLLSTMASLRLLLVMFLTLTVTTNAWGALSSPYECVFKTTSTLTDNQVTTGDVTWTLTTVTGTGSPSTTFGKTSNQSAIILGSGKKNYFSKMTLKTSAFSAYNVSKVVLYISSNNGGSKTITVKQGDTQIGTGNQSFSSATWVTNCTRNSTKGSGGDLSIEISSDATATFIHSITVTYEENSCSVKPTVGATLQSLSTTENSITATIPISSIGGCNITENGLVYSTSNVEPTVDGSGCSKVTTTACGSTAANQTVTITGLICGQSYYIRGYATNGAGTSYTNVTTKSTSDCPKYTVTLVPGSGSVTNTELEGASVDLPTPTLSSACQSEGWSFAGWATASVDTETETEPTLIAAGAYSPTSDITLYAVYQRTDGGGGGGGEASLTEMVANNTLSDGDKIVLIAQGTYSDEYYNVAMYQETVESSYVNKWDCSTLTADVVADDDKNWWTVTMTDGGFYLGDDTNGYLNMSSNNLYCNANKSVWTLLDLEDGTFKLQSNSRYLSFRADLTNKYWRMGGKDFGTSGLTVLKLYKYTEGTTSTTYYHSTPECGSTQPSVSFELNNGSGTFDDVTLDGNVYNIPETEPKRNGYNFTGWKVQGGDETVYKYGTSNSSISNITESITLVAQWSAITYTITYNLNGGSGAENTTYTIESKDITLPIPEQQGFTFAGWYEKDDLTGNAVTEIASGSTGAKEFWAKWTANVYTITFSINEETSSKALTHGTPIDFPIVTPCDGMVHVGWTEIDKYANETTAPSDLLTAASAVKTTTYYAVFASLVEDSSAPYQLVEADRADWSGKYLIAYNDQTFADGSVGGTDDGGIGAQNVKVAPGSNLSNDKKSIAASWGNSYYVNLEKYNDGYILKTQDGKYNYFTNNTSNGLSTTIAESTAGNYALNITFESSSSIKLALTGNALGSVFSYSGSGYFRFYKEGGVNPIYLYRQNEVYRYYSTRCKYTVSFDANGHGEAPESQSVYKNETAEEPGEDPQAAGYNFQGWYSNPEGTGEVYNFATKVTDNITLYAKWAPCIYTIAYKDQNDATFSGTHEDGKPTQHTYGTPTTLKGATKTGYKFGGWYKEAACTNKVTSLGATEYTANITLYAKWNANQYTITFRQQWGNGGTETATVHFDNNDFSVSPIIVPTRNGYTFGGYYTAESGAGTQLIDVSGAWLNAPTYIEGGKWVYADNLTLYAKWTQNFTITWMANGQPYHSQTAMMGTAIAKPDDPDEFACDDKVFVGWLDKTISGSTNEEPTFVTDFGTIQAAKTYHAVFATLTGTPSNDYNKITNINDLTDGEYVIAYGYNTTSPSIILTAETRNETTLVATSATPTNNKYTSPAAANIWEIKKTGTTYTLFNAATSQYIQATNNPTLELSNSNPTEFQISYSTDHWKIKLNDATTYQLVGYTNSSGNYFQTKYSANNSYKVQLYKNASTAVYSDYVTTCVEIPTPHWEGAEIDNADIAVDCGTISYKTNASTITFPTDKNYDLTYPITLTASEGFLLSTNKQNDVYEQSVTVTPVQSDDNKGKITQSVHVRADATGKKTNFDGTITISSNQLAEDQIIEVHAVVDCPQYTLTFNDCGDIRTITDFAGTSVEEMEPWAETCSEPFQYVFDGWATAPVTNGTEEYDKVDFSTFTMPNNNTTIFYAVYRYAEEGGEPVNGYVKVTEALADWSGDYVIAYSDQIFANGTIGGESGIGAKNNKVDLSSNISNNIIPATVGDQYNVTLEAVTGGYVLKTQDGKYNYYTNNTENGISASTIGYADDYPITVKFVSQEEINLCLGGAASGSKFRYNTDGYFRFYKNGGQQPVYLYKKADGTTYYTTSPICGPHLAITEGKEIYVTGGNAGGTRDLVIAQQKVSYKATRLEKDKSTGNLPSIKALPSNIVFDNTKTKAVAVTFDEDSVRTLQSDGTYTITGNITIAYQPAAANVTDDIQVTLNANYNPSADVSQASFTVHARSLPAEFVIVAKSGDKWYALNGDMNTNAANPANGQVTLDEDANPTKATYAPCNAIYTFDGVPNTGDRTYVRFQGTDDAWLWASSGTNVGIQNNVLKTTPEGSNKAYNWKLYTQDNITYQFGNANSSRQLTLSGEKFGMYASGVQDIRILPYVEKCLYNYAPTNLKVSVLKGTYVTLTWDAVAGATKYQYSTDATNWNDAGTEPTFTINGLTGATEYTYYIRAYHEDAGVSQECIDYAEITFTTADCDDVPTDITYSADLNSITVSWTAAAPTATITYNTKEDGTGGGGTINNATSPCRISGGLNKNTTYYIQILADGTCASPIIPVKTEDVEVDIVEWMTDGIIVDINTDEAVGVTLENEVSYGSGIGSLAEDLFFSKYFEGSGSLKMIAIYNGTGKDVDLSEYRIDRGSNGDATNIIKTYDLSQLGIIKQGQEIIFYSWPLTSEYSYSCSQSFLDSKVQESGLDANPRWILCDAKTHNGIEFEAMDFSGNDPLLLYKSSELIDVFGVSTEQESPASTQICSGRSDQAWSADGVTNMDYGKTTEDFPNGEIPHGVNVDDETITAYTARVIMFRKNTVVSGKNAVTKNTTTFATFAEEWEARQVCMSGDDGDLTCAAYQELGTFDYSDYYTKYESMNQDQEFDENDRNADGTVTIPIEDLYKHACSNIRVKLTNSNSEVLSDREYKVPIMITTTQGTDGQAFLALQENLATVEVDGEGKPTGNKTNLTLEQVREICKTCDVVVRDNATLMKRADDAANDHPEVHDIYVYENSSLIVPNGTNYTINNLSLRRKEDAVASVSAYPDALKLPESAAAPISLDFRLSAESWHWFTLPYDCNISEVTWIDGTPAKYNEEWFLMTYDGETRAATQAGGCWKAYTGTTIKAGEGFILAINGNINKPAHTYELRFPMSKEVLAAEGTDKTVDVRAWGVENNIRPNHKGWNLIGNPYLAYYQRDNITKFEGLRLGQLTGPDPQTGYWEQTGTVPYVVVPVGAGWIAYEQVLASETDLLPFTAYFVQVGNDGKHESDDELSIEFDHTKLQLSATPMPASIIQRSATEDEEPIIVGVSLTNAKGESDKTSLIIDDQYTDEYEMHADFFKWFGDYYTYYTKPVLYTVGADQGKRAFNALNEELATQPVALGMYAAQAGEYTFTLDLRSDLSHVEEIWLHDATENIYTNLLQDSYTFSTGKINGEGRFFLSVKMKPQQEPEPDPEPTPDPTPDSDPETSLDDIVANRVFATVKDNVIYISGLLSDAQLWIYDAAGRLMHYDQTKYYQHTYLVPQGGAYFVRVQGTMQTQTIKVVVK